MSQLPPPPPPPPPSGRGPGEKGPVPPPRGGGRPPMRPGQGWPRWTIWVLLAVLAGVLLLPSLLSSSGGEDITYSEFLKRVREGQVESIVYNNDTGGIDGKTRDGDDFSTTGFVPLSDADQAL